MSILQVLTDCHGISANISTCNAIAFSDYCVSPYVLLLTLDLSLCLYQYIQEMAIVFQCLQGSHNAESRNTNTSYENMFYGFIYIHIYIACPSV